ncbi:MAG: LysM peptidoglycan-binding domain-containing protein [Akkermansiaceae bacterium]|jgi:LysM repeat protein
MKVNIIPLLALFPLGFLASCNSPQQTPAAPPLGAPTSANPYGVPQINPFAGPGANPAYTPEAEAPYQSINPPYNTPEPYNPATNVPIAPAPAAEGRTHTIVKGESLWGISRKYGVTIDGLRQANSLTGDTIIEGRSLTIPAN